MSDYVTLTKQEFEDSLTKAGEFDLVDLPRIHEYVYQAFTANKGIAVRVYSTVDKSNDITREKGKDAIRVVFWDTINDRPMGKGKRIHRVEGATTIADRIGDRVAFFMVDAANQQIIDFGYVKAVLSANSGNFALSLLDQVESRGSLSDKQLAYVLGETSPNGYSTMEVNAKKRNPNFYLEYLNQMEEDVAEEPKPEIIEVPEDYAPASVRTDNEVVPVRKRTDSKVIGDAEILIPTSEFKEFQYPFEYFNPVQSTVFTHRKETNNMIIGANTSAGKTIAAELIITEVLAKGKKVAYLSPLKSLTQEKYDDWQKRFSDKTITIMTGDYVLTKAIKEKLAASDILCMTSEMTDSRTRKFKSEKNWWIREVGLVIVDESHILTTERGHAVEAGLMRFSMINPEAQILFLSATMPNVAQLGDWLTKLNGKETTVIYSTFRPVTLQKHFVEYAPVISSWGREDYWATMELKKNMAVELVLDKPNEKFLVFTHDKNTGRSIVSKLEREGIEAQFHNADLDLKDRLGIEESFKDKEHGIRVMVSTSTTSWGLNTCARNVVIVGVHRGLNEVDELDIIQMAGRAGRPQYDDAGFVYLICPKGSSSHWNNVFVNPRPVNSVLNNHATLAFHALAEIETGAIKNKSDLFYWYSRSLAGHQDLKPFTEVDASALMDDLVDMDMIAWMAGMPKITGLGRVSAWMYFSPYDVHSWHLNFTKVMELGDPDDVMLAWAISNIPSNDPGFVTKAMKDVVSEWDWSLSNRGLRAITQGVIPAVAATYYALTGDDSPDQLKQLKRAAIYDAERVVTALSMIDGFHTHWDSPLWTSLATRIRYGIGPELVGLVAIPGVGAVRAKKIYESGLRTVAEVAKSPKKQLLHIFNPALAKKIQLAAKEMV